MQRIAKFQKVSYQQFEEDFNEQFKNHDLNIKKVYENITLPKRATVGSAGYDFFLPIDLTLSSQSSVKIPTGIRVQIADGWVLQCYPRSSYGFKYRIQLDNTVGIIDQDYFNASNEGHIIIKITNDSKEGKDLSVRAGNAFIQGIFLQYGIVEDDNVVEVRTGGFGSTDKPSK